MFGIGSGELILLLIVALIVLGPERMPKLARDLGRAVAEFRKTSDELRGEFLNADKYLEPSPPTAVQPVDAAPAVMAELPATAGSAESVAPAEPDETVFDQEAREARDRLRVPARQEQARVEGWTTPTDEAGTSERWG